MIHLITYGHLVSTKAQVKEVRKLAEKLVTIARKGNNFNALRRAKSLFLIKKKQLRNYLRKLHLSYTDRPGGYTRIIPMGKRISDTAKLLALSGYK